MGVVVGVRCEVVRPFEVTLDKDEADMDGKSIGPDCIKSATAPENDDPLPLCA